MSERPTPETECEIGFFDMDTAVSADFARKLERERDEARQKIWRLEKQIEGLNNAANERFDEIERVRNERDEARELALKFRDALVSIEEYWNRDQNETAMVDACWHAVNMAHDALAEAKEVLP